MAIELLSFSAHPNQEAAASHIGCPLLGMRHSVTGEIMKLLFSIFLSCAICGPVLGQVPTASITDETIDRITQQEKEVVGGLADFTPIAETYIQEFRPHNGSMIPYTDHYFLSQAKLGPEVDALSFKGTRKGNAFGHFVKSNLSIKLEYLAEGFAQMAHPTVEGFDRTHYSFKFSGRESLGPTDCMVFEVSPLPQYAKYRGMFEGQIWVESKSYTIVRYRGYFLGGNDRVGHYFHFDSLRIQVANGMWLPSTIYVEESNYRYNKVAFFALDHARFRARTNFWGFGPVLVESETGGSSETHEFSSTLHQKISNGFPITLRVDSSENRREDASITRLQLIGLLAAPAALDLTLDAIMEKIQTANHLHFLPSARCRELLTSRLEFFTLGHTIVVSRGLIDVSNDEATLAAVIALGLARMELTSPEYPSAHQLNSDPQNALSVLDFGTPVNSKKKIQELAAEYLLLSPYKDSMSLIHEFFKELAKSSAHLPQLVSANLGDKLLPETVYSWSETQSASGDLQQKAFPLGIKTRIDPWTDRIVSIGGPLLQQTAKNDAPFEVTPFLAPSRQHP